MAAAGRTKDYDMQIKLLTIGNSGVGKTCLLLRYGDAKFSPTFITTIGIDFKIKTIQVDDKRIKLQARIWDTAGQERFRNITTSYFRGAQGILLVYDVTDATSFKAIEGWMEEIHKNADRSVNKVLVANKCDMESQRVVTTDDGQALARKYSIPYFETSAKNDFGVNEVFFTIAKAVKDRLVAGGAGAKGGAAAAGTVRAGTGGGAAGGKRDGCC